MEDETEAKSLIDTVLDALAALGIESVTYDLSGGGDSGECELSSVVYADGRETLQLPDLPIGLHGDGRVRNVATYLGDYAAEHPEGDWVNNDGGSGNVVFKPLDPDGERIEDSMIYHDEDEDGDYDEDVDDIELDEDGEPFDPSQIDDDTPITISREKAA